MNGVKCGVSPYTLRRVMQTEANRTPHIPAPPLSLSLLLLLRLATHCRQYHCLVGRQYPRKPPWRAVPSPDTREKHCEEKPISRRPVCWSRRASQTASVLVPACISQGITHTDHSHIKRPLWKIGMGGNSRNAFWMFVCEYTCMSV